MVRWLLLLPLLLGFLSQDAAAQIYINPADGVSVAPGGTIFVDNHTDQPAAVEVRLDDGTLLAVYWIPAWGIGDYHVPNSKELLGRKITTKATNGAVSASSTNPISNSDGALLASREGSLLAMERAARTTAPPRS